MSDNKTDGVNENTQLLEQIAVNIVENVAETIIDKITESNTENSVSEVISDDTRELVEQITEVSKDLEEVHSSCFSIFHKLSKIFKLSKKKE